MMKPSHRSDVDEFLLNLQNAADYKEADWDMAKLDRRKHKVKRADGSDYSVLAPAKEFGRYGLAVTFYFRFTRLAAWVLLALFLLQLPVMISNYYGRGMESYPTLDLSLLSRIMKLALTNQHSYKDHSLQPYEKQYEQARQDRLLQVVMDALCILVALGFIVYWQCSCHTKMARAGNITPPSSYTAFVKDLPPGCTERSIAEHFSQFARVTQVSMVMDISRLQPAILILGNLLDEYKMSLKLYGSAHQSTEQAYDRLTVHYWLLKKLVAYTKSQPRSMAFVTFDTVRSRDYVTGLHGFAVAEQSILRMAGSTQVPSVKKCRAQPHNLMWENIGVSNSTRIKQSLVMSCLFALVLFVGLVALFLIKINSSLDFQLDHNHQYTYAEVLQRHEQSVTDNFCYRLNYRGLSPEYYHLCKQFIQRYGVHLFNALQYSCVVVLINYLMNMIVLSLAGLNRYSTRSQTSRTLMLNMFVVLLLNTTMLPMLVQWETSTFSVRDLIVDLFGLKDQKVHIKTYSSFTRRWYLDVGVQIVMTYIVSFLVCPLLLPFTDKAMALIRSWMAKRKRMQKQMNMALRDPQFDFNYYLAQVLAIWFFCWMYASALPFLYLIGSLSLLATDFQSRIVFVKWSQAPATLDHSLNQTLIRILPISLLVHVIMSMQFLSVTEVMPVLVGEQISTLIQWIMLIVVLFYIVFKKEFNNVLLKLIRGLRVLLCKKNDANKITFEIQEKSFDEGIKKTGKYPLASYRIQDNPNYHNILYTMLVVQKLSKQSSDGASLDSSGHSDSQKNHSGDLQRIPRPAGNSYPSGCIVESERPLVLSGEAAQQSK